MALRYDGIEFDTVSELVEYKKKVGRMPVLKEEQVPSIVEPKVVEEPVVVKRKYKKRKRTSWSAVDDGVLNNVVGFSKGSRISSSLYKAIMKKLPGRTKAAIKQRINHIRSLDSKMESVRNTKWSASELKIVKEFYEKNNGSLAKGVIKELCKLLPGRTKNAVAFRASIEGFTKKKGEMIRKTPLVPKTQDEQKIDMAKKSTKPMDDYSFPKIYPIAQESHKRFEQMLIDIIGRKGKISMFDAQTALSLQDDKEWCGRVWGEFIQNFQLHLKRLRNVLVMGEPKRLRVVIENGFHYIKYG